MDWNDFFGCVAGIGLTLLLIGLASLNVGLAAVSGVGLFTLVLMGIVREHAREETGQLPRHGSRDDHSMVKP